MDIFNLKMMLLCSRSNEICVIIYKKNIVRHTLRLNEDFQPQTKFLATPHITCVHLCKQSYTGSTQD
jgi:hypothetical protein